VKFSEAVRHHMRQLDESLCMEDALAKPGESSRLRSFNRKQVVDVIREKLLCLRVMLSNDSITPQELRSRRSSWS